MSLINTGIVGALILLLPGVVAATIFYAITPPAKRIPIIRVFHALTFTAIIQTIAAPIHYIISDNNSQWPWMQNPPAITSMTIAMILAIILSITAGVLQNHDLMHKILRKLNITHETANPAWDSAFRTNKDSYVVLHLKDRRRLFGWPYQWPSQPKNGHFKIIEAQWLPTEPTNTDTNDNAIMDAILISALDIAFIEFIRAEETETSINKGDNPNA